MRAIVICAIAAAFAPGNGPMLGAQENARASLGTIDGVVSDTALRPLADATISLLGTSIRVATGANGRFRITALPAGDYSVLTRHIGYEPSTARLHVADAETLRVSVSLEPVITHLDAVSIRAAGLSPKMAEFLARREHGEGQYMTLAEIDARNSLEVVDVLRSFKGVSLHDTAVYNLRGHLLRPCIYRIMVDGAVAFTNTAYLPPIKDVAGIEVYIGPATIPLQFRSAGQTCGVILIWTKDGTR